jgi:hypothetical protein
MTEAKGTECRSSRPTRPTDRDAAIVPASEFSESPMSEASIARAMYDGRDIAAPAPPTLVAATNSSAAEIAKLKRRADFDGNEAGPAGAADGGTSAPIRGSSGSAPPPSSAKAVMTYLDMLNSTPDAARSVQVQREGLTSSPDAVVAATVAWDYAAYDNRLTCIEGRVSTLETKVDELPDRVFEKIAAWQMTYKGRLADEVTKIVNALTSSSASSPPPSVAPEVKYSSPTPPAPVAVAEPPMHVAPVMQYTPLEGAVPDRGGLPRAASAAGPRKGYRFGGGLS